ncbi:MAG: restriction endonuclease subunit S [Actinomycetota bacterium]|nr:restriction endonuclease subunit S [Actinomycetota bacterium]
MTWPVATLNDLQADEPRAITDGPFGSNLASRHYTESGPRVVRLQNIGDGRFIDERAHISEQHFESLRAHEVLPGDLLVASLGEVLPRACLAPPTLGPAIVKADCIRVRLSPDVDPRWVLYSMQRPEVRRWADEHRHGVGRPRLGLKVIRQIQVPLPPVEDQRRIVDLLEDHLSRLDAATAYLKSSRRRLLAMERGVLAELHHGPANRLGSLAWDSGYGTSEKCVVDGPGVPVVRIPNLVGGRIDLGDEKRVADAAAHVSGSMLSPGDLLIVRTNGSVDLIGRSAVVQDGIDAAYASYLIRYRLDIDLVRPEWVQAMLSAPQVRRKIEPLAASSAGQHNLSLAKLNPLELPVPSLAEQDHGLARLAELRESSARMRAELDAAKRRAAALRRAVLAAAFSGRLTGDREVASV